MSHGCPSGRAATVHTVGMEHTVDAVAIGRRVRELRAQRGLSQAQLAGPGVSASYASLIESGRRQPSQAVLEGLARALGTTVEYLRHGALAASYRDGELELRYANLELASGACADAEHRFRKLLAGPVDASTQHAARWGLAQALEAQGRLEQAIAIYEEVRARADMARDVSWLDATIALVRCYREAGDLGRSAELGDAALERFAALGLPGVDAQVQLGASVAFTAYERGDLVRARQLIERVMAQAEQLGSRRAQGAACWNASVIAAERGDLGEAISLSERALLLFAEDGEDRNSARLRNSYAELLLRSDPPQPTLALDLLESARATLTELGSLTDVAYCETEMARAQLLLGDPAGAITSARGALHHLPAAEQRLERSRALAVLADAWLQAGDTDAAEAAYKEAAQSLSAVGATRQAAKIWRQLAEHLERGGDLAGALAAMKAATAAVGLAGSRPDQPAVHGSTN